jgi:hypothetical protein
MNDAPKTPPASGAPSDNAGAAGAPQPGEAPALASPDAEATAPGWQAPWIATPEHPHGAADLPPPPQTSTGHYGPGYDDPTRHYGDTLPGQERAPDDPASQQPRSPPSKT